MEDLRRLPESDGTKSPDTNESKSHEKDRLLAALPVLRLITTRKSFSGGQADALDFVQMVFLRLLRWRTRHEEKADEMLREDWESFGARAAYNELKRPSAAHAKRHEPLDAANEIFAEHGVIGETAAEVDSLARAAWQAICRMTIRQRRALLLNSQDLIVQLLTSGIEESKLLEVLEISACRWQEIGGLALSDRQIAALDQEEKNVTKQNENNVKKARFEARAKIKSIIAK